MPQEIEQGVCRMYLGYEYLFEHLVKRFAVQELAGNPGGQFSEPILYRKDTPIRSGHVYIVPCGITNACFDNDTLAIFCNDTHEITHENDTDSFVNATSYVILQEECASALELYEYLTELYFDNEHYQEEFWQLHTAQSEVQDYLDMAAKLLGEAVLYFPIGVYRKYLLSKPVPPPHSPVYRLIDEKGEIPIGAEKYEDFIVAINTKFPCMTTVTDRNGGTLFLLTTTVFDKDNTCIAFVCMPSDTPDVTKAVYWHIKMLKEALEWHVNIIKPVGDDRLTANNVLHQLLSDNPFDLGDARRLLEAAGFNTESQYECAYVLMAHNKEMKELPPSQLIAMIESWGSGCYALEHDDAVVIIADVCAQTLSIKRLLETVSDLIKPIMVSAGVSLPIERILHLRDGVRLAKRTLETARQFQHPGNIVCFDEIAPIYILQYGITEFKPKTLCAPELTALMKKSQESGIDLVSTLRTYVLHMYNASAAARALFLHRSTLLYRLEQIEKITGISLNDPNSRLYLELSLYLMDFF